MPRSFDMSTDYGVAVEEVLRAFSDEDSWLARLGAPPGTDGRIDLITTQVLRSDRLPGVITKFHRGDLRIRREEKWEPVTNGSATATIARSIPDAPASLSGT